MFSQCFKLKRILVLYDFYSISTISIVVLHGALASDSYLRSSSISTYSQDRPSVTHIKMQRTEKVLREDAIKYNDSSYVSILSCMLLFFF